MWIIQENHTLVCEGIPKRSFLWKMHIFLKTWREKLELAFTRWFYLFAEDKTELSQISIRCSSFKFFLQKGTIFFNHLSEIQSICFQHEKPSRIHNTQRPHQGSLFAVPHCIRIGDESFSSERNAKADNMHTLVRFLQIPLCCLLSRIVENQQCNGLSNK